MKITKNQLRKLIQERVQDNTTLEIELANGGAEPVEIPWYVIMDALEDDLSVDGLFVEIEEFIENEYGFDEYFKLTSKADAEVRKMHDDYQAGGLLSDEESYERGFYEGKTLKNKLRKIIKEEKVKLVKEDSRDPIVREAHILVELDNIATAIEEIANGLWGQDDELAQDLELQVERLSDFYDAAKTHFEQQDDELGRR